jgi:predicted DCC family thiol-disulfide oxidoreductase YuxK
MRYLLGADCRSLAVLRVGVGMIVILDICQRLSDLEAHYTDFGVAPRSLIIENLDSRWLASLFFLSGAWQVEFFLFLAAGILGVMLLIGYRTRLATIGCWIFLTSLDVRNPYVAQGGDMLLRIAVFWSMFLPLGARFSVDSAWNHQQGNASKHVFSVGTVAYTAQIVAMYWFSVLAKSGVEWWREGGAVYYALSIDYMVTPLGSLVLQLPSIILKFATWSVLSFEACGPLLLLSPWFTGPLRTFAVFGFVALHCAFLLTLFVGVFPLIGIVSVLFFLPPWFWDNLVPKLKPSSQVALTVYYNLECRLCWKIVQLLKTFLLSSQMKILPAQSSATIQAAAGCDKLWTVVDESGRRSFGYQGLIALVQSSMLFAWLGPILRLSVIEKVGNRVFNYAMKPQLHSCWTGQNTSIPLPIKLQPSTGVSFVTMILMVYTIAWNIANLPNSPIELSERLRSVGNLVGLHQSWELFAPFPAKDDGWYVIPGLLGDGRQLDLFRGGAELDWRKPKYIALTIKNNRWRKFLEALRRKEPLRTAYAGYLCREWNRRHSGSEAVQALDIIYMLEWTKPNFEHSEPRRMRILKYHCG